MPPVGSRERLSANFLHRACKVAQAPDRLTVRTLDQGHRLAHAGQQNRPPAVSSGTPERCQSAARRSSRRSERALHAGGLAEDPSDVSDVRGSGNSRNGHGSKRVLTGGGAVQVAVPRDRNGSFQPHLLPKRQHRLEGFDKQVISLYARGMT